MLLVLGRCTYRCLILTVHSGTLKLSTQNGLCPLGVFIYSRTGMWVRPICISLAWNPIQTPLGKTQRFGWQCCNVAKGPGTGDWKTWVWVPTLCVCLRSPSFVKFFKTPSDNQFFLYLTGKLESWKTSLNFNSVPGCLRISHSPSLNIDFLNCNKHYETYFGGLQEVAVKVAGTAAPGRSSP